MGFKSFFRVSSPPGTPSASVVPASYFLYMQMCQEREAEENQEKCNQKVTYCLGTVHVTPCRATFVSVSIAKASNFIHSFAFNMEITNAKFHKNRSIKFVDGIWKCVIHTVFVKMGKCM